MTAQPSFSIPKEYADFVSSSTDLLEQFREGAQESDEVVYRVYLDALTDHVDDVPRQYELLSKLKETIGRLVEPDVSSYHWHRERFRLEIAYPVVGVHTHTHSKAHSNRQTHTHDEDKEASSLLCLKGVTRYGESLEDEWFIVYLLQRITRTLPHLCAQVSDADGEFLLIEAAEHIDDWLGPENARNRVWIRGGRVHVVRRETAGARRDGGMRLLPALRTLREESTSASPSSSSLASSGVQNAVAVRTTRAFPARARALQHSVACIVPEWVARALSADPSLVSAAVHAFSNSDAATLSAALSAIDLHALAATSAKAIASTTEEDATLSANNNTQSRDALKAVCVAMTRTLFAQLTFKQFTKIPRKYHAYVRRMAEFTSARVSLALNIGLRITVGLELAWAERVRERERFSLLREESQGAVENALREKFFLEERAVLSLSRVLLADVVESQHSNNNNIDSDTDSDRADWSLLFAEKDRLSLCAVLAHSYGNDGSHATTEEEDASITAADAQAAKEITTNVVAGDSEEWLHLSPEQLDAEIESRTKQFASLSPSDESSSDVGETTTGPVAEKEQPSSLSGAENDEGEVERLQKIVNDFKLFLNEKSDFDGISRTNKREKNSTQHQQKQRQAKALENRDATINDDFVSAELDTTSFDVAYLKSVLATFDLRLDGSVIERDTKEIDKVEQVEEERPEPVRELIAGIAQKFISTNFERRIVDEEDSIDSDDEIDEEQEESREKATNITVDDNDDDDDSDEESEDDADSDWDSDENSEGEGQPHHFDGEHDGDDDEDDDDDEKEFSMEEFQRVMDSQLFNEKALANTFAHLFEKADAQELADFDDMDLDANFLMSMMEAHAEGLGVPSGPINQILGQLGLSLPRPPPMNEAPKKNKTKK